MEELIYTHVNKFPEFKTIISAKVENPTATNNQECKNFKDNELNKYNDTKNSFTVTCSEIAKYHQEIINDAKSSQIALCKYISYWFYETLNSMDGFSHEKLLKAFYEKITNLKFCEKYIIPIKKKSIYDELNELYDLYDHFINFKNESNQNIDGSCEKAEDFLQLYEKSAGKCKSNYNNYVCWELIKIRAEYEHNRIHAKRCQDQMIYLTPIGNDKLYIILFPFVVMSLISFIFIFLYNFTSFDSWLLSKLPGAKKKTQKKVHRMHEFQRTSEMEGRRYKLPYHSS